MQLPLQLSFRQVEPSPEIEALVREKAAKLDRFADNIMSCRVVVELLGKHHAHGNQYEIRVDVTVAGGEVVATRERSEHIEYKNLRAAIRDAFDSVRRQLEDHVRRQRGFVKSHEGESTL